MDSVTDSGALPSGLMARLCGKWNCTASPTPCASPFSPLPASVVTAPVATSARRILWLNMSATSSTLPSGLIAMPLGPSNRAPSPTPSASPSLRRYPLKSSQHPSPPPPTGSCVAAVCHYWVLPSGLMSTPCAPLKCAAPPTPSVSPSSPLPASVVTAPVATSTRRILVSPTQTARCHPG